MLSSIVSRLRSDVRSALSEQGRVVLAVSGGVDSMVLLDAAAAELPSDRLVVATFDHGTGAAATEAADLVSARCQLIGVECSRGSASAAGSSEASLRAARWEFLDHVAAAASGRVVTAHTADDQTETVLMRIMRDSGARGLAGLAAEGRVLRPLLRAGRREIAEYARERRLEWVEDPSNASTRFLRNRVRHELLPALRRVFPTVDGYLLEVGTRAAAWRRDLDRFIDEAIDIRLPKSGEGLDVGVSELSRHSVFELRELLPAILARAGAVLDRRAIVRLAEFAQRSRVGARAQLSGDWEIVRSRNALQLRRAPGALPTATRLGLSESTLWSAWRFSPVSEVRVQDVWCARLPADRALTVRAWRQGDVMAAGTSRRIRKVKELLSRAGVTGHDRASWPVVVAGDDIVWIPGVRRSEVAADSAGQPGLSFACEYLNR